MRKDLVLLRKWKPVNLLHNLGCAHGLNVSALFRGAIYTSSAPIHAIFGASCGVAPGVEPLGCTGLCSSG